MPIIEQLRTMLCVSVLMKHLLDTALLLPQEGACVLYVVPVRDTLKRNTATIVIIIIEIERHNDI